MTLILDQQMIDADLLLTLSGSPAERSAILAEFAREGLASANQVNNEIVGYTPDHTTIVDGMSGRSEDDVSPDNGIIQYSFNLTWDVLQFIEETLVAHSPVGSGRDPHPGLYKQSHIFFADGVAADIARPPKAIEYAFINTQDYAAKIEKGESDQASSGVYQVVAELAKNRFGNQAQIEFNYRAIIEDAVASPVAPKGTRRARAENKSTVRHPCITVKPR